MPRTDPRCSARRVLLVSSRGNSCVLQLRSQLRARGYRIFSFEAHEAGRSISETAADAQAVQFTAWKSFRLDPSFISAFSEAIDRIQPHIVQVDADRRVLGHAMAPLLMRRQIPVLVRRGAIGGLNVLNPGDWLCFFGRRRQRLLCTSMAMMQAYSRSPFLTRLLPNSRLEMLHHHVPDAASQLMDRARARQSLGIPTEGEVVGTICAVRPVKNIATVAAAVRELMTEFPHIRLLVIGGHGAGGEIDRIKSLVGEDRVILPGPRPSARDYLNAFDVFVSPTQAPGEGFGLVVAEAMLAGRAIIASDVGAGPELVGPAGLVAPALDVRSWRAAIRKLLLDPALRISLGNAARSRALEIFGAATISNQLAAIYDRVLDDA